MINRNEIVWPSALKTALCRRVPTAQEWEERLKKAAFGVEEVARALAYSRCKDRSYKNFWRDLQRHCQFTAFFALPDEHPDTSESRISWNSFEDMLFDDEDQPGKRLPFVGGPIYSAECEFVLVYSPKHNDQRSRLPIPVVFNPALAMKQREKFRRFAIPEKRRAAAASRSASKTNSATAQRLLVKTIPDRDICEYYGLEPTSDQTLFVSTGTYSVRSENAKFFFSVGTRAQLVCNSDNYLKERNENPDLYFSAWQYDECLAGGEISWPSRNEAIRRRFLPMVSEEWGNSSRKN